MKFNSLHEAFSHYRRYEPWLLPAPDLMGDSQHRPEFGDWLLMRHYRGGDKMMSSPILGIFCGWSVCDQALVLNLVESPRAWMWKAQVLTNPSLGIYLSVCAAQDVHVSDFVFWHDDAIILGHWRHRPSFREIRAVLQP